MLNSKNQTRAKLANSSEQSSAIGIPSGIETRAFVMLSHSRNYRSCEATAPR